MNIENLLPEWETVRVLGSGGFGKVYEIMKKGAENFRSALKVISIPQSLDEYSYYRDDGYDDKSIVAFFKEQADKMMSEIRLMSKFKGSSNIVSYEDHCIIPINDYPGWNILIRMELLTPLPERCMNSMLTETDVCTLGVDICHALELCESEKIIHRDIKPHNIFINKFGDYKLGDFGIAKSIDYASKAISKVGTYAFMAPEVYCGKAYNATVDIYSLGLVMYWLLNERRLPFLPLPPKIPSVIENTEAQAKRLKGEQIPLPQNGCDDLKEIVIKALNPDPKKRYKSASEMKHEIECVLKNIKIQESRAGLSICKSYVNKADGEHIKISGSVTGDGSGGRQMVSTLVSYTENVNAEDAVKSMALMSDKGVYTANLNNISLKCVDLMQNGIYATYAFFNDKKCAICFGAFSERGYIYNWKLIKEKLQAMILRRESFYELFCKSVAQRDNTGQKPKLRYHCR